MLVSRDRYDEMRQLYYQTVERYDEAMTWNRTLVQTIVDMRRDGFANTPKVATQPERSARANVEEAIRLAAGGDKGHASVLRAWVASKRAEGIEEDAIAKELLQPAPADEEGVPA